MNAIGLASGSELARRTEVMAGLFAQVLGRAEVAAEADFFDLGGDSILATGLMVEIERITGRALPVTAIYDAPTAAAMARLLAAAGPEESRPGPSRLVLLRPGATPALFMPHGLLGIVTDLYEFAQRLDTDRAIYAIQANGGDATAVPADRVEAMARLYVEELRRMQPSGPYLLAGYCFGGLLALEMARELRRVGEPVGLLALLDTHPHSKHWPWRYRAGEWLRLARSQLAGPTLGNMWRYLGERLRGLPARERLPFLVSRLGRLLLVPFSLFRLSVLLHRFERADNAAAHRETVKPPAVQRMTEINVRAFQAYRPRPYDGAAVLLQTLARKRVQFDGHAVWGGVLRDLQLGKVDAHGWESVDRLVACFAAPFSQRLRAAVGKAGADRDSA
jgi:acetoacetyl-CoA synthetase